MQHPWQPLYRPLLHALGVHGRTVDVRDYHVPVVRGGYPFYAALHSVGANNVRRVVGSFRRQHGHWPIERRVPIDCIFHDLRGRDLALWARAVNTRFITLPTEWLLRFCFERERDFEDLI